MRTNALLFFLLIHISFFAQDYTFGKVSKAELEEKFYPLDSTADAVYLFKKKETFVEYTSSEGWLLVTLVHNRIKFYNKKATRFGKEEIKLFKRGGTDESVTGIKAYTYNLVGKKIVKDKLQKKQIFENELTKNWFSKSFAMPNIKEGSVVEYKYRKTSPYFQYIDEIEIQHEIPVKKIDVIIKIPEYFVYKTHSKGYLQMFFNESFKHKRINYSYRQENRGVGTNTTKYEKSIDLQFKHYELSKDSIPAIESKEPFVSSINQFKSSISFELNSIEIPNARPQYFANTWKGVSKRIYRTASFGEEIQKSSYFKNDLENILNRLSTPSDKLMGVFQFVKNRVKWDGQYGKYTKKGVRKAFKDRTGNVAEINLMLTSMLRFAGLNANPVLVSTRANGVSLFPTIDGFNYIISMVEFPDGSYVLLDATEPYSLPNILPERVLNWNGRKVTKEGISTWVKLTPTKHSLIENNLMIKISEDINIEGLLRTKFDNLAALNFRKKRNHIKDESLITLLEEKYNFEINSYKVNNKFNLGKQIVRDIKFKSEDVIEEINEKLYIIPLFFLSNQTNPFKLEDRKFPVDFATPWKEKNISSFIIPEGYVVEQLPKPLAIGLPEGLGVFKYQIIQKGNKISVISLLQFNNGIIAPQYYSALKDFYSQLVKKQTEKIVLIKE
ncbi:DUF3857 domain-containing protein [Polaribacter sp. Z022]|uniref:DUF3857 domain-containing protein n=1 Tax=Polaribacter sp. Z022 TaxID=2927125 RepID=UPI00202244E2|nr:DUF3857 domain-containing protein [Polaribacter sp. Z022]MCL7754484.1 DUF3857 domain-containing protein [Polaribacter sp. Z022]